MRMAAPPDFLELPEFMCTSLPLADRHATLEESAVAGQAEHEDEVDEGDEGVDFDIGEAPFAGAVGGIARRQDLEEADDDHKRGLLEGDNKLVDRRRQRIAHGLRQHDAA